MVVDQGMPVPNRRLVGYRRVSLGAGARSMVTFAVTAEELALVDSNGDTQPVTRTLHRDLIRAPYDSYGVKCVGLVSLAPDSSQ